MFSQMQSELIPTRSALFPPFSPHFPADFWIGSCVSPCCSCISITAPKLYSVALQRMSKLIPALYEPLKYHGVSPNVFTRYSAVTFVGQAQLLRRVFASELNFSAQLDSNLLYSCLAVLNGSALNDLRDHYRHPDQKPYPQGASITSRDCSLRRIDLNMAFGLQFCLSSSAFCVKGFRVNLISRPFRFVHSPS